MQLYLIKTDVENSDTYIYDTKKETLTNTAPVKMKVVSLSKELFNQAMKDGRYSIVKKVYDKMSLINKVLIAKRYSAYWVKGDLIEQDCVTNDYIVICYPFNFRKSYNDLDKDFRICSNTSLQKGTKRPSENWINKISKAKYLRCIKGKDVVSLSGWEYYDAVNNVLYERKSEGFYATHLNKCPCPNVKSYRLKTINYKIGNWLMSESENVVEKLSTECLDNSTLEEKVLFAEGDTSMANISCSLYEESETEEHKPVESDGGKSSYYEIVLPQWLLDKQEYDGKIMLEDLAEVLFHNDFNFTNVFKSQKRMFELTQGRGKKGNTFEYDAKKGKYYIDKQVEVFNREVV